MLALAACDDGGIDPSTRITAPRVLAITTEPSALPLDGELALTTLTVDPDGPRIGIGASAPADGRPVDAMRMRACAPWKFITDPGRDCVGDDALPLELDASGRVVTLRGGARGCIPVSTWRARAARSMACGTHRRSKLRVPIIAEVEVDGQTLIARRDVDVVETTVQRQNPRLAEIRFDGISTNSLRAGQRYVLTAAIDRASLDEAPDAEPSGALENVVVQLLQSDRRAQRSRGLHRRSRGARARDHPQHVHPRTTLERPGMFVIATDETGGMSATSVLLTIE